MLSDTLCLTTSIIYTSNNLPRMEKPEAASRCCQAHCAWQRTPSTRPTNSDVWKKPRLPVDVVRHTVLDNVHHLHVQQPPTYEKPEACECSFRPLMMGGVSPETCRASYGIIKVWYYFASCWIFLYKLFSYISYNMN